MSGYWLYGALVVISIGVIDSFWGRVIVALGWVILLNTILDKKGLIKIAVLASICLLLSIPVTTPMHKGRVSAIRNSYIVVTRFFNSVMLYGEFPDVSFDDVIIFQGELQDIESYNNFEITTFESWAKGQNIHYQCDPSAYEIVKEGVSLRHLIYLHNHGWANQLLFGEGNELNGDYAYLFSLVGFHFTFLISLIRKYYARRYYPYQTLCRTINAVIILGVVFGFPYALMRSLLGLLAELLYEDKRDRFGFQACLLVLYKPYYVRSLAFMIPMGIRFLNVFSSKNSQLVTRLWLIIIQLRLQGYCEVVSMVFFSFFRSASSISYLLALLSCFLPFSFDITPVIEKLLAVMDSLPTFYLHGRMSFVLFVFASYYLSLYVLAFKKKYVLTVALIMIINGCQCLWHSGYTITFLDVGQGDCALITFPHSFHGLLIDTGGSAYKDVGSDIVVPYLRSVGIYEADVIISHSDTDHAGALESIQSQFPIRNVYEEKQEVIQEKELLIYDPLYDVTYEDINDNSQVSYFQIEDFGFLFTGDISKNVEETLVQRYGDLPVTLLKVSHHGSTTGTSDRLLATYQIPMAVISAGRSNRYNHPSSEVSQRLDNFNVQWWCTADEHAIRFYVYHGFIWHVSSGGSYGLYRP